MARKSYNASGVPHYAASGTAPIHPQPPETPCCGIRLSDVAGAAKRGRAALAFLRSLPVLKWRGQVVLVSNLHRQHRTGGAHNVTITPILGGKSQCLGVLSLAYANGMEKPKRISEATETLES